MKWVLLLFNILQISARLQHLDRLKFYLKVGHEEPAFITFYDGSYPSCGAIQAKVEDVAAAFGGLPVVIGEVDCVAEPQLCKEQSVDVYPHIRYYKKDSTEGSSFPTYISTGEMVQHLNEWTQQSATLTRDTRRVNPGNAVLLSPLLLKDLHKKEVVMGHPGIMTAKEWAVVEFYPGTEPCPQCKKLEDGPWSVLPSAYNSETDFLVARMDAEAHPEFAKKVGVTTYPSIVLFKRGKKHAAYFGPRETGPLMDFIQDETGILRDQAGSLKANAGISATVVNIVRSWVKTNMQPECPDCVPHKQQIKNFLKEHPNRYDWLTRQWLKIMEWLEASENGLPDIHIYQAKLQKWLTEGAGTLAERERDQLTFQLRVVEQHIIESIQRRADNWADGLAEELMRQFEEDRKAKAAKEQAEKEQAEKEQAEQAVQQQVEPGTEARLEKDIL